MPRFAAVTLPCLRLEIAGGEGPRAVVVACPGGAVQGAKDLRGGTRLDEVSLEARALGIHRGATVAAARSRAHDLRVGVVSEGAVHETMARLAELGLAFGAASSFDMGESLVWVEITGCAHLFDGERPLAERLGARVAELGHACRVAVADGPRVAAAVARHAPIVRKGPFIVGPGKNGAAMRVLPIAALPLDEGTLRWLAGLGVRTVGDLQTLAPNALAGRLGAGAAETMALIRGDDAAPITPYRPPEIIEERADVEYGIEATDALLFVAKTLCDRVASRLEGRAMGAAKLELEMSLDRAMLREGAAQKEVLTVVISSPLVKTQDLFAVLRARVESYVVTAPVLGLTLRVPELARIDPRALHLYEPMARADEALPRLAAELAAELGQANVGVLRLVDTWVAESREQLVPYGTPPSRARTAPLVGLAEEPVRFLAVPRRITGPLQHYRRVARQDAIEWWRGPTHKREMGVAWFEGALAWVEIDRETKDIWLRGWVD